MKSYRDLQIYQLAFKLNIEVHEMSVQLPKFEMYEIGAQLRRAAHSVKSNIVEGYGRRSYKQEFIRFLTYSESSLLETISDLETIKEIYPKTSVDELIIKYEELGKMLYSYKIWVLNNWKTK